MLEREDFKNRFTNHMSIGLHEFFYPLMQAYDSIEIKADIELGGTDQRFNILMGRTLQEEYGQEKQVTLFMPLLEGTDGTEKMSKSLGNYVGINEDPRDIYAKVMQIPDNLIIKYFELATDIHPDEIKNIRVMPRKKVEPHRRYILCKRSQVPQSHWSWQTSNHRCGFFQGMTLGALLS